MQSFSKYTNEIIPVETDFSDELSATEVLVLGSCSVTVTTNDDDQTDVSSTMVVDGSKQLDATSKKLQAKLSDQALVFVYLCYPTTKKIWQATIKEAQLGGDHYLLTKVQHQILARKFNIKGISRYILVDKNGKVVAPKANHPSVNRESINYELLTEISELLKS